MADEIISRADARAKGLKQYFDGLECSSGHIAKRSVANGGCKACAYEAEKRYKAAHPEKLRDKWRTYEQNASPERIAAKRVARAKWEAANPEKTTARINKWKRENADKVAGYEKKWRDANPEKVAAKNKRYKAENAERLAPIARERVKEWREANPDAVTKISNARRARKKAAPGSHTTAQLKSLLERQDWKCAEATCRASLREKRHLDHIQPLSKGGSNDISNLQYLCPGCNCRKNAKDPLEWARQNGRLL